MTIDVSRAHFLDISAVGALDKIVERLRSDGKEVRVVGYNEAGVDIVDRFALHDKTGFELGVVPYWSREALRTRLPTRTDPAHLS